MIKEYKLKDGTIRYMYSGYYGTDPLSGKKIITKKRGFKTRKQAELAEARFRVQLDKDNYRIIKKDKFTFAEVLDLWLPVYETTVKESTFQIQSDVIRLHISPKFGHLLVDKITTAYCQEQVNYWFNHYSKYSNFISLTTRILEYARLNLRTIQENPMKDIIRPKPKQKLKEEVYEAPYYDSEQLNHFMTCAETMSSQEHIVFRLIAYTGMRQGEVCGLKWSDFDEVNHTLSVSRTVARGKDYKKILQTPKTTSGERIIPLDDTTVDLLKRWRMEQKQLMIMLGFNTNTTEQFIITNEKNEFQYSQYPYTVLKKIRKKFNIDEITVHGLRHTHCCLLIEAGVPLKEVQDRLGHEDMNMILSVYNHVNKKKKQTIGNTFADFIENKNG